jgi:hypothetical protein
MTRPVSESQRPDFIGRDVQWFHYKRGRTIGKTTGYIVDAFKTNNGWRLLMRTGNTYREKDLNQIELL